MNNTMLFTICSFFYSTLLLIVYFSKKRLNVLENKIYALLIVTNWIGIIIEILVALIACYLHNNFVSLVINKAFLVYLLTWIILFTFYTYVISFIPSNNGSNDNKFKSHKLKTTKIIFLISYIFLLIPTIFLPLYFFYQNGNSIYSYTYGPNTKFLYIISSICIALCMFFAIKNIKNIKSKKYVPLFAFLLVGSIAIVVQSIDNSMLLFTSTEAFVTFLMYFTIENPDLKMINELNIAKDQAERANNAKSDFLSNMSHEIRTPLNAIVGFSQALSEENLPPQAQEEVKDIIMASDTLLDIVNGILDISKIEANKLEIVNTEYSFNAVLEELVSLTKARLGEKPLEFRCVFDPSIPPYLYGDKVRVKQVILNLLTNAVKYTKEGWIEFKVSSIQKDGVCRLIISVEDSGIGIKQESIDKLFTKFERLDIEKNNTIEGTGLGLAITKKLLELMNGQIVVQSVYGKGSKFTVAIDQKIVENPTTIVEVTKVSNIEALDLSNKKILVVDDNKINLKVATRLLKDYNCQIETVESGFECIEKIKAGNIYDLVLMDDMMPKMSGVETFHHLQEIPGYNIPTIALTANAISGMKEKYLKEGFNDYLAKPIEKTELYRVLTKFLQQDDIL